MNSFEHVYFFYITLAVIIRWQYQVERHTYTFRLRGPSTWATLRLVSAISTFATACNILREWDTALRECDLQPNIIAMQDYSLADASYGKELNIRTLLDRKLLRFSDFD